MRCCAVAAFGVGFQHGMVIEWADAPGGGVTRECIAECVEIVDGGCACCAAVVANATRSCVLQEIAACDTAALVIPHNAADKTVAAGNAAGVVAVFDAAAVIPHNAADSTDAADAAGVGAVYDVAVVLPCNAADIQEAADCAGDGEIFHGAASADIAKEALIIGTAAGDIEAADGLAVAVEGAAVLLAAGADWDPLVKFVAIGDRAVFVNLHVWVEVDIGGEDGVGCRFAAIDALRKFQQLRGGADLVHAIVSLLQHSPLTTL